MNSFWKFVLINVAVVYFLAVLTLSFGDSSGLLIIPIVVAVLEFLLALLFLVFDKTRAAAKVMLMASGIIFLVGLGVCSVIPFRIQ
jgi:hypothetical protein